MNVEMLKYLVDLHPNKDGDVAESIDVDDFLARYPHSGKVMNDLYVLRKRGYIEICETADGIHAISVNKAALDYFK